jgi:hypothetical protein
MQNVENSAGFAFFILHLSFRVPFFITLVALEAPAERLPG